jgi:hypothetical protein
MTLRYAVGIKIGNRADQMTVEAEDALIAALKVKTAHPEAAITYVRKRNARGDRRHPHSGQIAKTRAHAPHDRRLSHGRHSGRSTARSPRPCLIPCPSLLAARRASRSSSRTRPGRLRHRRSTDPWTKRTIRRSRGRPKSFPNDLRLLHPGSGPIALPTGLRLCRGRSG